MRLEDRISDFVVQRLMHTSSLLGCAFLLCIGCIALVYIQLDIDNVQCRIQNIFADVRSAQTRFDKARAVLGTLFEQDVPLWVKGSDTGVVPSLEVCGCTYGRFTVIYGSRSNFDASLTYYRFVNESGVLIQKPSYTSRESRTPGMIAMAEIVTSPGENTSIPDELEGYSAHQLQLIRKLFPVLIRVRIYFADPDLRSCTE